MRPELSRTSVVEVRNLTKRYDAKDVAVDDLNLDVRRGEVYGFLGPNGAGKTTTLKMLLGLVRPSSGTTRLLGQDTVTSPDLTRVGALIEAPAFYPYLSGRDNLRVLARYSETPRSRVEAVLRQVGLSDRAKVKSKKYSLGMKQRLGVAAALLKEPELLILDEPSNGLDPKGMAEMRDLIRELGSGDRTVVLSSHLLAEVEQICDRVGVMARGRLVAEGTVAELKGQQGGLEVSAEPVEEARRILERLDGVGEVRATNGMLRLLGADPSASAAVNGALVSAGLRVGEIRPIQQSLEDVFLRITEEDER